MVGGESPHVDFEYYVDIVRSLHEALPDVHLKLFTASEIHHMTKLSGLSHEEVLRELQAAGLGSLPGGGAEVFADRVRRLVAPGKEHPDFWFRTHDTAHRLGIPTHCTMLYGHVETYEERVDHLLRLRAQQDETGGFLAFIPLAFHPENTVFERRGWRHTTGSDDLKMIAVSRLLLDNIPNIKAYWIMMGLPLAQVALHFGANDVQGTVVREQIFHAAGARTETEQKIDELVRFVREAGRIPVQRDTLYNELRAVVTERDPPRPHLVREHGAGLLPARRRGRGGAGRADRAEPAGCSPASSTSRRSRRSSTRATPAGCGSCRASASGSEGAVDSIQLVSQKPLEQVRSVAVTPESATSVVLTKVLLPEAEHVPLEEDGRREAPDRRRRAEVARSRIRPRTTTSGGSGSSARACRWSSPSGPAPSRSAEGVAELEDALVASRPAGARGAGAARPRGERALRLSRRLSRALLREAPLPLRPARARRADDVPRAGARRRRARARCPSSASSREAVPA